MTLSSHPNLGAKDSQTKCQYLRMNVSAETKLLHCLCQQTNHTRCIWGLQDTNYFAAHLPSCNNCNCTFCTCSTIGPSNYICLTHQCYTCFCNHSTVNYREVVWYALPFAGKKGIYGRQAKQKKSKGVTKHATRQWTTCTVFPHSKTTCCKHRVNKRNPCFASGVVGSILILSRDPSPICAWMNWRLHWSKWGWSSQARQMQLGAFARQSQLRQFWRHCTWLGGWKTLHEWPWLWKSPCKQATTPCSWEKIKVSCSTKLFILHKTGNCLLQSYKELLNQWRQYCPS